MGKQSLLVSLFAIVVFTILYIGHQYPHGSTLESLFDGLSRLSFALLPIGVIFGVVGLFRRGQSKWIAVLGIVVNAVMFSVPVLAYLYPEALAFTTTDRPLPWIKAVTKPTVTGFLGDVRRLGETTFYVKTNAGEWERISFPESTFNPRLAVLSSDAVLIAGIGRPKSEPKVAGEVFRRGVANPVALIPQGNFILPVPSGGFIATRLEPDYQHQPTGITVERYDSNGERVWVWSVAIPDELAICDWGPSLRLVGDDPVYGAGMCHALSGL